MKGDGRDISGGDLEGDCRWEAFRGSGPGGQKRNKTSSAVRYVHEPTGLSAVAGESRSQAENRVRAFRRLRHALVLEIRREVELEGFERPVWFVELLGAQGGLKVSSRDERYLGVLGLVLDVLAAAGWRVSEAARALGVSTGALVGFLRKDEKAWGKVNQARAAAGMGTLVGR